LGNREKKYNPEKNELTTRFVKCSCELIDGWWDLKSVHKNSLLSLQLDVVGPSNESGDIPLWLNCTSNSKVSGFLFEKGILLLLLGGFLHWGLALGGGGWCFLRLCKLTNNERCTNSR
jgi:hypothetical protein